MFIRTKENFVCEHCGNEVVGNGYTNHCPECLWSKHVDIEPGDRLAECGGLMEPIGAEEKEGEWRVLQKCTKCSFMRKNKISAGDNFANLIKISQKAALE